METNNRRDPRGRFCARTSPIARPMRMRRPRGVCIQLASACAIVFAAVGEAAAQSPAAPAPGDLVAKSPYNPGVEARAAYAKLPLSFVPNAGQLDTRVRYSAQSGGASFYFTTREAVLAFAAKARGLVLRLRFLGADPKPAITGHKAESGTVNYIIGNDPARWHTNLPTYGELLYRDLWPGIDLLFRSENGQLQYEFLLRPGARVQDIQLAYRGATRLSLDRDGNLMVHTSLGSITDTRPVSYQLVDGKRVQVSSRFALQRRGTTYAFAVGAYDRRLPLIVDPGLVYSTYLGGTGDDSGYGIAVDSAGQAYVTGGTYSATDFPKTAGAYNTPHNGTQDVFVTKLNSSGSALVYSTYFGGSGDEPYFTSSIAVDRDGYAYVSGDTLSPDFPTTPGAFQTKFGGVYDAFVTKLNNTGTKALYSTFVGGTGDDIGYGVAVDPSASAYVTGSTTSTDFRSIEWAAKNAFTAFAWRAVDIRSASVITPGRSVRARNAGAASTARRSRAISCCW